MRVFENSALRKIFGPKWEEVTGEVHKEYDPKKNRRWNCVQTDNDRCKIKKVEREVKKQS